MRTLRLALALAALLSPALASAQTPAPCDSCASCTTALAAPHAQVELAQDLTGTSGDACITVRGEGALLDGHNHAVRGPSAGAAVRIEARGAVVRNVHAEGAAVGIVVANAPEVTLYHDVISARDVGLQVTSADGVRVHRAEVHGGRVGIAFGDVRDGRCAPGTTVASPGAVVHRSRIEGAQVGIAACDALPVLTQNAIVRNGVGVLLAAPARGASSGEGASAPYDACACAPTLDATHTGTTLLYSSGCGGCQVHEGWLPELRASHHDIRARETGLAAAEAGQRFDAFMSRCVPEVMDSLGIPGCVPNYACLANGAVFKTRSGAEGLALEAHLESAADVAHFAEACASAAARNFHVGGRCVRYQLRDNVVCGNRTADIRAAEGAARFGGADDACNTAEGWTESGAGCANHCPADLSATALAAAMGVAPGAQNEAPAAPEANPPAPAEAPTAPSAPIVPSAPPPEPARTEARASSPLQGVSDRGRMWIAGGATLGIVALVLMALLKKP